MKRILSLAAAMLMLVLLVLPVPASAGGNAASEARNGVVRILSFNTRNGQIVAESLGTGSGFAVGEAGKPTSIFITNNHVVAGCSEIYILLDNEWMDSIDAGNSVHAVKCEVLYTPKTSPDYAILKASREITERVALPLMPAKKAFPGDTIYALGYPGIADSVTQTIAASIDDITITKGTISRFSTLEAENTDVVQVDAAIQHGNSGGPLITENGQVIAINTGGYTQAHSESDISSVNYSVQVDYVINKLNELISSGKLSGFTFTIIEDPEAAQTVETEAAASDTASGSNGAVEEEKKESDKGGFSPVILIVALVAVAAVAAVVLVSKKGKQQKPAQPETPPFKPTVQVRRDVPVEIPSAPVQPPVPPQVPETKPVQEQPPAPPLPPQPPRAMYFLIGKDGHFAGKRIPVSKELHMGRQSTNELAFPSDTPGVSGSHCVVSPAPNGVYLTDLGSTYGTVLSNGTKLPPNQKYLLKPGESFCVGTVNQKFMLAGTEHKAPGTPAAAAAPAEKAVFTLAGQTGVHAGRRYPIGKELRLGRGSANDVSFPEGTPGISGSHCILIPRGNSVYVVDLGSTYGTYLSNGTKLPPNQKQPLSKGDSFYLGSNKQMFRIE